VTAQEQDKNNFIFKERSFVCGDLIGHFFY